MDSENIYKIVWDHCDFYVLDCQTSTYYFLFAFNKLF